MEFFKKKSKVSQEEGAQLLNRVIKALSSEPNFADMKIELSTPLKEDPNINSLDSLFIVMALEKEFNVEMLDEAVEKFLTVGDVIEYLYGVL